jgi:hypothetical protein
MLDYSRHFLLLVVVDSIYGFTRTHNDLFHAESLYFEGLHFELHVQCDDGVIVVRYGEGEGQTHLYVVCYGGCSVRR